MGRFREGDMARLTSKTTLNVYTMLVFGKLADLPVVITHVNTFDNNYYDIKNKHGHGFVHDSDLIPYEHNKIVPDMDLVGEV